MRKTETYTVSMRCSNCLATHAVSIPKGQRVGGDRSCPTCGCTTLQLAGRPTTPPMVVKRPGIPEDGYWRDPWGHLPPWRRPNRPRYWCKSGPQTGIKHAR